MLSGMITDQVAVQDPVSAGRITIGFPVQDVIRAVTTTRIIRTASSNSSSQAIRASQSS